MINECGAPSNLILAIGWTSHWHSVKHILRLIDLSTVAPFYSLISWIRHCKYRRCEVLVAVSRSLWYRGVIIGVSSRNTGLDMSNFVSGPSSVTDYVQRARRQGRLKGPDSCLLDVIHKAAGKLSFSSMSEESAAPCVEMFLIDIQKLCIHFNIVHRPMLMRFAHRLYLKSG